MPRPRPGRREAESIHGGASRPLIGRLVRPVSMLAVAALIAGLGIVLAHGQQAARTGLEDRFDTRIDLTSRYAAAYAADVLARETSVGSRRLSHPDPTAAEFQAVTKDFGFEAAVLLDDQGRVMQVVPARRDILGADLASQYDHLRRAVTGEPAISNVVPSAARGIPVVAFAAPFSTLHGQRVLSGAFDVSTTPLSTHLRNALPHDGGEVHLIDATGAIVASNLAPEAGIRSIADLDAGLATAIEGSTTGHVRRESEDRYFTTEPVAGTTLSIVASVPEWSLYAPLSGTSAWAPWIVLAAFALAALYTVHVLFALHSSRQAYEHLAKVDPLTGMLNRREFAVQADRRLGQARAQRQPAAVLMVDIDRFKSINDTHGHDAGDEVLRSVTARIRHALRHQDIVARWGGEEFIALLPDVPMADALRIAERVRASVSSEPISVSSTDAIQVTISVGCSEISGADWRDVIGRADQAMYEAKRRGSGVQAAAF